MKAVYMFIISAIAFHVFANTITITSVNGTVQLRPTLNSNWENARQGQTISTGYYIYTGFNSSAILKTDNAVIEVKPLSQASISSLIATQDSIATDVYLKYGKIKADVQKSDQVRTVFKVRSANSTASVRGTIFTFGEDTLFVEEGTVSLLGAHEDTVLVQKNERALAQFLALLDNPLSQKKTDYLVDTSPIGISDAEAGADEEAADAGGNFSRANVIIRITVKQ